MGRRTDIKDFSYFFILSLPVQISSKSNKKIDLKFFNANVYRNSSFAREIFLAFSNHQQNIGFWDNAELRP